MPKPSPSRLDRHIAASLTAMDKLGIDYLTPAIIAEAARIPFEDALRVRDNLIEIHHWTQGEEDIIRAPRKRKSKTSNLDAYELKQLKHKVIAMILQERKDGKANPAEVAAALRALPEEVMDQSEIEAWIRGWREKAIKQLRNILDRRIGETIDKQMIRDIEQEFRNATQNNA